MKKNQLILFLALLAPSYSNVSFSAAAKPKINAADCMTDAQLAEYLARMQVAEQGSHKPAPSAAQTYHVPASAKPATKIQVQAQATHLSAIVKIVPSNALKAQLHALARTWHEYESLFFDFFSKSTDLKKADDYHLTLVNFECEPDALTPQQQDQLQKLIAGTLHDSLKAPITLPFKEFTTLQGADRLQTGKPLTFFVASFKPDAAGKIEALRAKIIKTVAEKFPQMQTAQRQFVPHVSLASMKANVKPQHLYLPAQLAQFLQNPASAAPFMKARMPMSVAKKSADAQKLNSDAAAFVLTPHNSAVEITERKGAVAPGAKTYGEKQEAEASTYQSGGAQGTAKQQSVWTEDHEDIFKKLNSLKDQVDAAVLFATLQDIDADLLTPRRGFKADARNKAGKTLGEIAASVEKEHPEKIVDKQKWEFITKALATGHNEKQEPQASLKESGAAQAGAAKAPQKQVSEWTHRHIRIFNKLNKLKTTNDDDTLSDLLVQIYEDVSHPAQGFNVYARNEDGKTLLDIMNEIEKNYRKKIVDPNYWSEIARALGYKS